MHFRPAKLVPTRLAEQNLLNYDFHCSPPTGDLRNENSVFEWLIDDDNRELDEQIESVNGNMLEKLLESSPFIAVFFCKQRI